MDPLVILVIGMAVVILSVLWLRLHAFLALLAGGLVVAWLTSPEDLRQRELLDHARQIQQLDDQGVATLSDRGAWLLPARYAWVRRDSNSQRLQVLGDVIVQGLAPADDHPAPGNRVQLRPVPHSDSDSDSHSAIPPRPAVGDWLIDPRDLAAAQALAASPWPTRVADGFGDTCGKIGIVIAMAAIIGRCLLDSGAAERIVAAMRAGLGERNTPAALALSGFVIGVPVFFDTVFYLLLPLARALARRSGRDYLLYILSIIVGATMAHSLVPPTPGPLLVAAELNVGLGMMILAGSAVGLIAVAVGFAYALWANRRWTLPLRDDVAESAEAAESADAASSAASDRPQPPLWLAALPIVLPVALLSIGTLLDLDWGPPSTADSGAAGALDGWLATVRGAWRTLGDKHVALGMATLVALLTLVKYRPAKASPVRAVQEAILSAGTIVLITAAGGAFGAVLRQSGIADAIQQRFPIGSGELSLLLAAFLITAVVRVAQGSATVAMITAVGIVAPLVQTIELPYHPVYVALAIGCGSKPIPWMNDSGFWVVTRMSGMTEAESLRTYTVMLTLMGLVGLAATLAGAVLVPLT